MNIVSDSKKAKTTSFEEYVSEIKKLLLLGDANSPINTKKCQLFSKLAQEDVVALEVLRTTHSLNLSAEVSKKKLLFVLGTDDE